MYKRQVQSVDQLYNVKQNKLERLTVAVPVERIDDKVVSELVTTIEAHLGPTSLFVQLTMPDHTHVMLRCQDKGVNVDKSLLAELRGLDIEYRIN